MAAPSLRILSRGELTLERTVSHKSGRDSHPTLTVGGQLVVAASDVEVSVAHEGDIVSEGYIADPEDIADPLLRIFTAWCVSRGDLLRAIQGTRWPMSQERDELLGRLNRQDVFTIRTGRRGESSERFVPKGFEPGPLYLSKVGSLALRKQDGRGRGVWSSEWKLSYRADEEADS